MATRKLNMFEKIANMVGVLYRHQANQFPRRYAILKAVFKHELAPPNGADLPKIKADWMAVEKFIHSGQYKQLSVKVPADYVSKETRKKVAEEEAKPDTKHGF